VLDAEGGVSFLELGSFHFPLTSDVPCLRTYSGLYMLPFSDEIAYGISLPEKVPDPYKAVLNRVLHQRCTLQFEVMGPSGHSELVPLHDLATEDGGGDEAPALPRSERIALAIETGAETLSGTIANSADILTTVINTGQMYLQSKITPLEEPLHISPFLAGAVRKAATGTTYIVTVKPIFLERLLSIARYIGGKAAFLLPRITMPGGSGNPSSLARIGRVTATSALQVWQALEKAGAAIARQSALSVAAVVEHKYGSEAAALSIDTATTLMNTADIYTTGPRSIARKMAMEGGKSTVKSYLGKDGKEEKDGEARPS